MSDEITVGSQAPNFKLPSSKGNEIGLADYHDKSRVVLFFVREFN